ncbi:9346_t:CDS:1 [Funneliformis mosseae]|uniref:9346_t:CDS:1 n=1 Tax=Funneliformis mosseae TaxID=27381 RepID=A0A9N9G733_FUNMO|nr:9346_t:CDS:1 [Funneliformis mosseae]
MKIIKKLNLALVIAVVVFITFASSLPNLKRDDYSREFKEGTSLTKRQDQCPAGYSLCKYGGCCYGTSVCYPSNVPGVKYVCDNNCGYNPVSCGDGTCCRNGERCTSDGYCEL